MTDKPVRPRQVTLSGWLVLVGSVVIVGTAFQQIATLGSIEAQESAAKLAADSPVDGLGLTADDVQTIERVLGLVAGAGGAAAAILGLMLLRRRVRSDRLALTVLAPVLLVAGLAAAGLVGPVVVAAIAFLWTPPARDWFDGRDPEPPPPRREPATEQRTAPLPPGWPAPSTSTGGQVATAVPPLVHPGAPAPARPPRPVVAACIVTWVACGLAVLGALLTVAVFVAAPDTVIEQLHDQNPDLADQGVTDGMIRAITYVAAGFVAVWALAAAAAAVLVIRRVRWARVVLLVSATVAGVLCLFSLLGSAVALVPMAACLATSWLLTRAESRAWFDRRGSTGP